MDINFTSGRFVSSIENGINYQEVLNDFKNASTIRIITYNISKNEEKSDLLNYLETLGENVDVRIITNIPSRFPAYFNSPNGEYMRNTARKNIKIYLEKLNPKRFPSSFASYFNFKNHAKIIGTENIVYIGSANFSYESKYNIETGIITEDRDFIRKLYSNFFDSVVDESTPYYDDDFQVLRLFTLSLLSKFTIHKEKLLEGLYRFSKDLNKYCFTREKAYFSDDDLTNLVADIIDFQRLDVRAENTYSEEDDDYNNRIDEIVSQYSTIKTEWLINISSTDDVFYNYINFDSESKALDIFEEEYYAEAYDESLDEYMQKAMDDAQDMFDNLATEVDCFSDDYLNEINKIIKVLKLTSAFIDEYSNLHIHKDINNTHR